MAMGLRLSGGFDDAGFLTTDTLIATEATDF
jgi:hypothetical protein